MSVGIEVIPEEQFVDYDYDGVLTYTINTNKRQLIFTCDTLSHSNIKSISYSYSHTIDTEKDDYIKYIFVNDRKNMLSIYTNKQTIYFEFSNVNSNGYEIINVFLEQKINDVKTIVYNK